MHFHYFRRLIRRDATQLVAICISLLLMLSMLISYFPYSRFDIDAARMIQSVSNPFLTAYLIAISWLGNPLPSLLVTALTIMILLFFPIRGVVLPLLLLLPADAFSFGWKFLIERPRPSLPYVEVISTFPDPSFPSLHVVHFIVFFGFLGIVCFHQWMHLRRKRLLFLTAACMLLVCLIPFSRVYVGAHWPSDVVGGILVGAAVLVLQLKTYQILFSRELI